MMRPIDCSPTLHVRRGGCDYSNTIFALERMKQSLLKILCGCGLFLLAAWAAYADKEQELLGVLQSSADIPAKCDACKELRLVGTAKAVPGLAACLNEDRLSQAARFALEGMPCPEAT